MLPLLLPQIPSTFEQLNPRVPFAINTRAMIGKVPGTCCSKPDELVTLKIGPNAKVFMVHKQVACEGSPVFKAVFKSTFVEGQSQTYVLADTSEEAGRILTHWLYIQSIDWPLALFSPDEPEFQGDIAASVSEDGRLRMELWILADKLLIPDLQNLVMRDWHEIIFGQPAFCTDHLHFAYENTSKDSLLRKFLIDWFVFWAKDNHHDLKTKPDFLPHEFLNELAQTSLPMAYNQEQMRKQFEQFTCVKNYLLPEES